MADTLTHESHFTGQAGERRETLYHCRRAHIGTSHVLFRLAFERKLAPSPLLLEPPLFPLTPTGVALVKTVNVERRGGESSGEERNGEERRGWGGRSHHSSIARAGMRETHTMPDQPWDARHLSSASPLFPPLPHPHLPTPLQPPGPGHSELKAFISLCSSTGSLMSCWKLNRLVT